MKIMVMVMMKMMVMIMLMQPKISLTYMNNEVIKPHAVFTVQ